MKGKKFHRNNNSLAIWKTLSSVIVLRRTLLPDISLPTKATTNARTGYGTHLAQKSTLFSLDQFYSRSKSIGDGRDLQ